MSMGIGTNTQNPDEGELKRDLEKIACGVWFTSTGSVMPKLVKYPASYDQPDPCADTGKEILLRHPHPGIPVQYGSGKSRVSISAVLLS